MVNAIFDESRYFSKNSIDYYLLTPKVIKGFPLPSESKEIRYYYSSGDGTKPTSNGVTIIKKTPFDSIYLKNAKIFLQKKNRMGKDKKTLFLNMETIKNEKHNFIKATNNTAFLNNAVELY
jgi:hypothetical protein